MINKELTIGPTLQQLGKRLKEARLSRNESQDSFAQRLCLSRQSYGKMEKGAPQTPIGNWLAACSLLDRLGDWQEILADREDLFAKFEKLRTPRQRAGATRKGKK